MQGDKPHGLDPKKWGPHAWSLIHMIASVMNTEEDRRNFQEFIAAFAKVIPCSVCKQHFAQNRQKFDIRNYTRDAESLLMWTYLVHDSVNFAQEKSGALRPSWLEVRSRYFKIEGSDKDATPGSSEDYEPTICTEVCGATMARIQSHQSENRVPQVKMKISSQNTKSGSKRR